MLLMLTPKNKKSTDASVTIVTNNMSPQLTDAEVSKKKCIIAAITVGLIFVVGLAVGGTLLGSHMSNQTLQDMLKVFHLRFTNKDGTSDNENVNVNVKDNFTEYNVPDERFHVATDNRRGLVVYKMEVNNNFACYLTPMDRADETDSKDVVYSLENTGNDEINSEGDEQKQYAVNSRPIKDKSFLSPNIKDFCKDLEAYWLTEKDGGAVDGATTKAPADLSRQKRGCYYRRIILRRSVVLYRYGRRYIRYYYFPAVRFRCYG